MTQTVLRNVLATLACALYVYALLQPALLFEQHDALQGFEVLMLGWLGVLSADFAWFANPMFALSLVFLLLGHPRKSAATSAVGFAIGLLAVFAKEWWFNEGSGTPIKGLGSAYYVWMASFVVLLLAGIIAPKPATQGRQP